MIRDPATGLPGPRRLSATAPGDMAQVHLHIKPYSNTV